MTKLTEPNMAALAPVHDALIAHAHAAAAQALAVAEAEGRQELAAAHEQAGALLTEARTHGAADGTALLAVERERVRRAARRVVLGAQRAAYDELRDRACVAVRAAIDDPARRARLIAVLRGQLGGDAIVREPADGGVVAATSDGRSIDASVGALVDAALAGLDLEPMWTAS